MPSHRHLVIAGSVVLFHVAALWALQTGLLQRAVEVLVPVALLTEFMEYIRSHYADAYWNPLAKDLAIWYHENHAANGYAAVTPHYQES